MTKWQPIETAPSLTEVLCRDASGRRFVAQKMSFAVDPADVPDHEEPLTLDHRGEYVTQSRYYLHYNYTAYDLVEQPTHWMPLPDPSSEEQSP